MRSFGSGKRTLAGSTLLVFSVSFMAYAWTACRTVGPGDSGELSVVLSTWGVAHAPGFPLLSLIGNLISYVLRVGEPAFALNLLSSFFGALAAAVLSAACSRLSGHVGAGIVTGLALAATPALWHFSLVIEVFSLNALLAAILLLCLAWFVRSIADGSPVLWPLPLSALTASGVITHQPTLVLVAAPVLVVEGFLAWRLYRDESHRPALRRATVASALAGLAGLVPLVYLPLAARRDPPLNWGDIHDLAGFMRFWLRADFGSSTLMSPAITVSQILEKGESASPLGLRHQQLFWASVPGSFGWALTVLMGLGVAWTLRRARPMFAFLALFLAALSLFLTRVNTPVGPLYNGVTRAFYIMPHVVLALFGGLGLGWLQDRSRSLHARAPAAACLAVAIVTLSPVLGRWREVDMNGDTFIRDLGANLMAGMPRGALVLSTGDLFRNSFHYQQECLGRRRDLTLVEQETMATEWYVRQLRNRHAMRLPDGMRLHAADPTTGSRAWLDLNLESADVRQSGAPASPPRRPIVTPALIDFTYAASYRLQPMGLYSRVFPIEQRIDPWAWLDEAEEAARQWDLSSLARTYSESSWERAESAHYTNALANLRALEDMVREIGRKGRDVPPSGVFTSAASWLDANRAEYLADQAAFWRSCLSMAPAWVSRPADSLLVSRSEALCEASLAIDPENFQALRTLAGLLHDVPALRDLRREVEIRRRIVAQRPGDSNELSPYFTLVSELMDDPATRDPEMVRQAIEVHRRFLRLLDLCIEVSHDPALIALRRQSPE